MPTYYVKIELPEDFRLEEVMPVGTRWSDATAEIAALRRHADEMATHVDNLGSALAAIQPEDDDA
jgi:hypothetical protein